MADAEISDGNFSIIKWLLIYVVGVFFGIIIVVITAIAMFIVEELTSNPFKQRRIKNVAFLEPRVPLANYNFTEEFRINTSDKGEAHFVKMKLAFGIAKEDQTLSAELAERNAEIRDLINLIVGRKSKDELINIEDQLDLREEIKAQVNHILNPPFFNFENKIQEVYFTEFIVN